MRMSWTVVAVLGLVACGKGGDRPDVTKMISCYDHDCGKLATCFDAMVTAAMRPAGGSGVGPREPAAMGTAVPATGSAPTP